MTTSAAAENKAGHPADKEKMEKRRALGRGLESLLPRPRVVAGAAAAHAPLEAGGVPVEGDIHAVVEGSTAAELRSARPGSSGSAQDRLRPGPTHAEPGPVLTEPGHTGPAQSEAGPALAGSGPEGRSDADTRTGGEVAPQEGITIMAQAESRTPGNLVVNLAISDIDKNPFQTRYVKRGEALNDLAESIKANGVVQPILVRPAKEEGRYILILGERRLHASTMAGKTTIPAIIRRVSEQQAAEMTIVENLQREDLSPLEQAEAFRVLSQEFNMTQSQIGERVGLSRESVANYMRLLKLPREVMQLLAEKKIKFAEARELLKLESDEQITKAALYAVKKGLTIEQVERLVLSMNGWLDSFAGMPGQEKKKSGARWVDPNVRAAQVDLERLLGVRVKIRDRKGKGKIVIEYSTVDDYERVVGMLRGKS